MHQLFILFGVTVRPTDYVICFQSYKYINLLYVGKRILFLLYYEQLCQMHRLLDSLSLILQLNTD